MSTLSSQQFCLKWNNHTTNMLSVFESLLSTEALVDVTLACEGLSLKAHKMVLSACSPFFQSLFLENPCKHPIVIMKDMRYCDLKAIIDFMYRGEVNVSHDQLSALLKTAETLKVKGLAEVTGQAQGAASGIVQQEITQQSVPTPTPTQRTDTPPLHGKRKRGRPRKRSLSDSNRSDDEGVASKIKDPGSPEIEELSGDASMETSDIRSGGGPSTSQSQVPTQTHSSSNVNSFSKSHLSSQDPQVEDQVSGDENEFEVEPSKLLEQTLTTDNVPSSNSNSSGHITLPSVSGLEISRRSISSTENNSLVPVSDSSNMQGGPDSPQDIKPQIISFDDPPISPVAGTSHNSERSMMMYMDQSGVASIPGPSNYQDNALVSQDSQPQVRVFHFSSSKKNQDVPFDFKESQQSNLTTGSKRYRPIIQHIREKYSNYMKIRADRKSSIPWSCHFCQKSFKRRGHLVVHLRLHTGERPFCCMVCGMRFKQSNSLKLHVRIHTGEKPYTCKYCSRHFSRVSNYKRHLNLHEGINPFECHYCGEKFPRKSQLELHLVHHGMNKPSIKKPRKKDLSLECNDCGEEFPTSKLLRYHICEAASVETDLEKYECEYCEQVFFDESFYRKHVEHHQKF